MDSIPDHLTNAYSSSAPSQSISNQLASKQPFLYADFYTRLKAWALDFLLFIPIVLIIIFARAYFYVIAPVMDTRNLAYLVIVFPFVLPIYNIIFLHFYGTTLGKKLCRLRVISSRNNNLTLPQIILRETVGKYLSGFLLFLGYFWVLIDTHKQSFHDKIAGTCVIKDQNIVSIKKDVLRYLAVHLFYFLLVMTALLFWFWQTYDDVLPCGRKYTIYESLEAAFKEPQKVCMLNLTSNHLTQVLPDIGKLTNLKVLYLSDNQINELPSEFWQLRKLRYLSLAKNQLTQISHQIGTFSNLRHLDLSHNQLTSLPLEISKLKRLQFLILLGNPIQEEEKKKIKQFFPKNAKISIDFGSTVTPAPTPIAITPIITELPSQSWQIKLEKISYIVDELTQPTPALSQIPRTGGPAGVAGRLFAAITDGEYICRFINYNESMFLEKQEGNTWVRLCDQFIPTDTQRQLSCEPYNASEGVWVYGISFLSTPCALYNDFNTIEPGTYRLHTIFYTKCNRFDENHYADPTQCEVKKDTYSPEIEVKK